MTLTAERPEIGPLLRDWRRRRRMSQLDLALEAGVSSRHLSFVETGRSRPSAEMGVPLAQAPEGPLRQRLPPPRATPPAAAKHARNAPEWAPPGEATARVRAAQEPYPALVADGHWGL